MRPQLWHYPETPGGQLRAELSFAVLSAAALFLLRPVFHKSMSYTATYAVTWLVMFTAVAVGRFLWRRRGRV